MSETILRQLAMLQAVPRAPRAITAARLKERLEDEGFPVTVRSVQRDLETLSSLFPLESDESSKPFGWSWRKDALRELPGMDGPTALMFTLAERVLAQLLPQSSLALLRPYFRNANSTLRALSHPGLAEWPSNVRVLPRGQRLLPAEVPPEVLGVVSEALLSGKRFACRYRRKGETEARSFEVSPLGLVFRDTIIYLVATLWDYGDVKQLTLHRIAEPQLLDKPSNRIPDFDLDGYIADGAFGYKVEETPIRLRARFRKDAAQHLYETALSEDQSLTEEEGKDAVILEATVLDTEELRWWLLGFGYQVEVLEPGSLRENFRAMAEELYGTYQRG
jgi:predicted DNA-binding transcriptional regulator YafY